MGAKNSKSSGVVMSGDAPNGGPGLSMEEQVQAIMRKKMRQSELRYHAKQVQRMKDMGLRRGRVDSWVEVWDYAGGNMFRGFVAGEGEKRSLFVFFGQGAVGKELKSGLMALLELAPEFDCARVVACIDRSTSDIDHKAMIRNLGWVGFELTTLDGWVHEGGQNCISDRWLFLGMEI